MADGTPPRRPTNRPSPPPADDGYEVVGDTPPKAPVRAKPVAAKSTQATPAPAKPAVAKPTPAKPAVAKPAAGAKSTETKVVRATAAETPKLPAKPKVIAVADDDEEDDRPRTRRRADDDEDDDRPKKSRKKKNGKKARHADDDDKDHSAIYAYVLLGVGVVLSVVGAAGFGGAGHAVASVLIVLVGQLISIPITLVALMVIGSVLGIEYGTLGSAIRNLSAMSFLVNGLSAVADWAGIPFFFYAPVISMVSFGLFMTLFDLDVFEAMITSFILNLLARAFWFVMFLVLLMVVMKKSRQMDQMDGGPDWDAKPGQAAPFDPADDGDLGDGDDEDRPKRPQKKNRPDPAGAAPKAPAVPVGPGVGE